MNSNHGVWDGKYTAWVDDILISDYSDMLYSDPGEENGINFHDVGWVVIYGGRCFSGTGADCKIPSEQYFYTAGMYVGDTNPGGSSPTPTPIPSVGGTLCHLLTSSNQTPTGYGASYNPLTTAKELLMSVLCQSTSATITLGNNSNLQYIYNKGYIYRSGAWQQVTYNCSNLISNAWCVGNANATIPLTSTEMASINYILGYICSWSGTQWQCGCRDSSCSVNYLNLQEFRR